MQKTRAVAARPEYSSPSPNTPVIIKRYRTPKTPSNIPRLLVNFLVLYKILFTQVLMIYDSVRTNLIVIFKVCCVNYRENNRMRQTQIYELQTIQYHILYYITIGSFQTPKRNYIRDFDNSRMDEMSKRNQSVLPHLR